MRQHFDLTVAKRECQLAGVTIDKSPIPGTLPKTLVAALQHAPHLIAIASAAVQVCTVAPTCGNRVSGARCQRVATKLDPLGVYWCDGCATGLHGAVDLPIAPLVRCIAAMTKPAA